MNVSKEDIAEIAAQVGLTYAELAAFIEVESGGAGFINGKIVIQFEPHVFRRYVKPTNDFAAEWAIVNANKVEGQTAEWKAFNAAYRISPQSALMSTSIGLMQIMGFNHAACGFKAVNDFWDYCKASEKNQIIAGAKFIQSNKSLYNALKSHNWARVAYYYNGANYAVNKYDSKLARAYDRYK